jgi:hypothetical protein
MKSALAPEVGSNMSPKIVYVRIEWFLMVFVPAVMKRMAATKTSSFFFLRPTNQNGMAATIRTPETRKNGAELVATSEKWEGETM